MNPTYVYAFFFLSTVTVSRERRIAGSLPKAAWRGFEGRDEEEDGEGEEEAGRPDGAVGVECAGAPAVAAGGGK